MNKTNNLNEGQAIKNQNLMFKDYKMKWWHCVIIYLITNLIGILSTGFNGDEAFYNNLNQPKIAPPDWLFAPMWFFLNVTSLIALYTIVNLPKETKNRKLIIWLEAIGWILYVVFSFAYFKLKSPVLGMIDTVLSLVVVILVVSLSFKISKKSFWFFLPRLLWLSLASYVSTWIVLYNNDVFMNIGPFLK